MIRRMMLHEKEFICIGFIRKAYGFKGQVTVEIEDLFLLDLEKQKFLFLELDGYKIPFKIEEIGIHKGHWLKLKTIDTPEAIADIKNKSLFLLKEDIRHAQKHVEQFKAHSGLAGMNIYDLTSGRRGVIDRVEEYPQQLMAIILIDSQEYLVPLVEAFISNIDEENDMLTLLLPEGLL